MRPAPGAAQPAHLVATVKPCGRATEVTIETFDAQRRPIAHLTFVVDSAATAEGAIARAQERHPAARFSRYDR